eukprot:8020795-Ditylum_brightwellii.AAC.1
MEVHAPALMLCLRPPRAWLGNLNHKGGRTKGDPSKNQCGAPALPPSAPHQFLEGKGISRYYT